MKLRFFCCVLICIISLLNNVECQTLTNYVKEKKQKEIQKKQAANKNITNKTTTHDTSENTDNSRIVNQNKRGEWNKNSTVYYPSYNTDSNVNIKQVSTEGNYTKFRMSSKGSPNQYITVSKTTYIIVNGKKYKMLKAEGIAISPSLTFFDKYNQTIEFDLYFPIIKEKYDSMDLIETGNLNSWKIFNIRR